MSTECIFCRIVAGELPSTKVYEDEDTLCFMDIGPVIKGHTLVIPKQHVSRLTETPDAILRKLIVVVRRIARAHMEALAADGLNVTQANGKAAGQIVDHLHFHVIPRFDKDGHSFNWKPGQYDSSGEMEAFAARIRGALPGGGG